MQFGMAPSFAYLILFASPLLRQITCGGFGLVVSTHGLFSSVFLLGFMGQIYVSVVTQDRQF